MERQKADLTDWANIAEVVRSESSNPHRILGAHLTDKGMLVQALIPTARDVSVKLTSTGRQYVMEQRETAGFFSVLIPRKTLADYTLLVFYDNGTLTELRDPYSYAPQLTDLDLKRFAAGVYYTAYEKMGAHPIQIKGIAGVSFAVWAPSAKRVSVVGEFNGWDGRCHQMRRLAGGIFEIFIPGLKKGTIYSYEIRLQNGTLVRRTDPYAAYAGERRNLSSVVWDVSAYQWNDAEWMSQRAKKDLKSEPMSIYEVHLGSWKRRVSGAGEADFGSGFYHYRELAVELAAYVKEMGYTHIELMPIMEHVQEASWGYQITGYYAPTSRFGTPDDFMYFMDYMHAQEIGVILDWVPSCFPKDACGLAEYDGTALYEHSDPKQGEHPYWGTLLYHYDRSGVANFLIGNAIFWADCYHADGLRFHALASMLYLDYGKNPGEWIANIYGGRENLEAVQFLKRLNSVFRSRRDGAVLIAEEAAAWPRVTGDFNEGGLGFDYKWNAGWLNDFLIYMKCDPYYRCYSYNKLTLSMIYHYSEQFMLTLSHEEMVHGKGSMASKMPGRTREEKLANLRAAYGFMLGHPGKKLLFMGQDFGQLEEWSERKQLPWSLLKDLRHSQMQTYVKELNHLYTTYPALFKKDSQPSGFEWINCMDSANNIVAFVRKTDRPEEMLLFVCNFAPVLHEKYQLGVPFAGKYKEILCSDALRFGGGGRGNSRVKTSRAAECNGRDHSITIVLAPLGVSIFRCIPEEMGKRQEKGVRKVVVSKRAVMQKTKGKLIVLERFSEKRPVEPEGEKR